MRRLETFACHELWFCECLCIAILNFFCFSRCVLLDPEGVWFLISIPCMLTWFRRLLFLRALYIFLNHSSSQEGTDCRITVLLLHIVSIFQNPQGMEMNECFLALFSFLAMFLCLGQSILLCR